MIAILRGGLIGVALLSAACAEQGEFHRGEVTARFESTAVDARDGQGAVTFARILSPDNGKFYEIPVPPGYCPPDPADPFTRYIPWPRHRDSFAAFVPCVRPEGAPWRSIQISTLIPAEQGTSATESLKGILSEIGEWPQFSDLMLADSSVREAVQSPSFFSPRSISFRVADRDRDVRFTVSRVVKDVTIVQVLSLVAVDDHIFHLSEGEYRPLQDGGTSVSESYVRRVEWMRMIEKAGRRAPSP
jgi:hypothetical protein